MLGGRESRDDSHVSLQHRGREESRRARQMRRNSSLVTTTHRGDPWPGPGSAPSQCFPWPSAFFVHRVFLESFVYKSPDSLFPRRTPGGRTPTSHCSYGESPPTYHSLSATLTCDLHPGGSWVNATRSGLGPGGCLHLLWLPRLPGSSRQFLRRNSNLGNEQWATSSSFVSPVWRQDCCRYLGRGAEPQVKVNLHTTEPWNVT